MYTHNNQINKTKIKNILIYLALRLNKLKRTDQVIFFKNNTFRHALPFFRLCCELEKKIQKKNTKKIELASRNIFKFYDMNYFIPAYNFTGDGEEINVAERKRFKHSGFTEPKFYTNEWYLNTYFKNLESRVEIEDDLNNFNEHRFNFNFFYFNYDNFSEFSSDQDTLNLDVKDFY